MVSAIRTTQFSGQLSWAGYFIGFGLGGFFDGILLHQVLQWHHLLSNVKGAAFQNIEIQILADGLFHVLMYVIAITGLWLLWKVRGEYAEKGADKHLIANALIGFGAWNIIDSILSHWILGIHRIRIESENVLLWDLLWFFVFGVAFVAIGWILRKRGNGNGSSHRNTTTALLLALSVMVAGPIAALPPKDVSTVMVFFKPGTPGVEIFRAIDVSDSRIIWASASGNMWALDMPDKTKVNFLYQHGAYLINTSAVAIGCFAWLTAEQSF